MASELTTHMVLNIPYHCYIGKRALSGTLSVVSNFIHVTVICRCLRLSAGMLTGSPFSRWRWSAQRVGRASPSMTPSTLHILLRQTPFGSGLGLAHSSQIAFTMKPFFSSVLWDLTTIIATTSKICTKGTSSQLHSQPSTVPSRSFTSRIV